MSSWLRSHSRTRVTSTDGWYLRFADELFSLIASSRLYADKSSENVQNAAVLLTLYLEDSIANDGGWRRFRDLCYKLYGRNLPFYEIPDDYVFDEINEVDIAFVLWKLNSSDDYDAIIANP